MKQIIDIRTDRTLAAPGVYAFDAEAKVRDLETQEVVYVHVNWCDDFKHYTVSKESVSLFMTTCKIGMEEQQSLGGLVPYEEEPLFSDKAPELITDFLAGEDYLEDHPDGVDDEDTDDDFPKFIEEYDRLADTKKSAYRRVFDLLNRAVSLMSETIE